MGLNHQRTGDWRLSHSRFGRSGITGSDAMNSDALQYRLEIVGSPNLSDYLHWLFFNGGFSPWAVFPQCSETLYLLSVLHDSTSYF
jgi:hypothetical protein